ncbi:MAG: peptide chain release factor N(5)-glutamine methyltransferase [Planctomycetes bacterium]|nr:peptide chain release factor N(5)-glutamine methyltransferase [Planctomycetota bacterium]
MPDESWTIGRLLRWTSEYFGKQGADSPRLDAEVLLAHALACQRIALYTRFDEEPPEASRTAYREMVKQRAAGQPVAYLVGKREFYSLSFRVSSDVLVPRPETEFIVVQLLDLAKQHTSNGAPPAIADVGTGSGILAVCAAKYLPTARVTAIDISPAALTIAQENAAAHGVGERIEFVESDLFAQVPAGRQFDFVLSNPPYIRTSEMAELPRDVRDFEPHLALAAGERGLDVIERLVPQAAERLRPGGWLLMEISPQIEADVLGLIEADGRLAAHPTVRDSRNLPRVIQARRQ